MRYIPSKRSVLKEIHNIINDMPEVLHASQMQKLQEVLINRLFENTMSDYLQTGNEEFVDTFLTAKHLIICFIEFKIVEVHNEEIFITNYYVNNI